MHTSHVDKRHDARILGPLDFMLAVVSTDGPPIPASAGVMHSALDLSEGGLRYHDDREPPENALLEIRLQPGPSRRPITRQGRVRWKYPLPDQHGFDVGIQFIGGSNEDRRAWETFVGDRLERIEGAHGVGGNAA